MPRRILVTGFEPFGGSGANPSEQIVRRLLERHQRRALVPGLALHGAVLPVVGGTAAGTARSEIRRAIARHQPDVVVCFGEAASRAIICVERTAFNERTYRIADNSGHVVSSSPVTRGAPPSLKSTAAHPGLLSAMRDALRAEPVMLGGATRARNATVRMSDDAGRFLCNEVLFDCLHRARGAYEAVFIHVPQTPAQARVRGDCGGTPLPVAVSVRTAAAAICWLAQR